MPFGQPIASSPKIEKFSKQPEKKELFSKIVFVRYGGGLSEHPYKKLYKGYKANFSKDSPHTPPETRGIFAFIAPYKEEDFFLWDEKKGVPDSNKESRRYYKPIYFKHHGKLWCHFIDEAQSLHLAKKTKGNWVLVDTIDLPKILRAVWRKYRKLSIEESKRFQSDIQLRLLTNVNPLSKSSPIRFFRDDFEVYIPKIKESK